MWARVKGDPLDVPGWSPRTQNSNAQQEKTREVLIAPTEYETRPNGKVVGVPISYLKQIGVPREWFRERKRIFRKQNRRAEIEEQERQEQLIKEFLREGVKDSEVPQSSGTELSGLVIK